MKIGFKGWLMSVTAMAGLTTGLVGTPVMAAESAPSAASLSSSPASSPPSSPPSSQATSPTPTTEELTAELSAFRVERLSAADRRAVLSLHDELMLVAPGDELPGIGWNRVLAIQPDQVRVAMPDSRTAILIVAPDGTQRIEWIDGRLELSPPMQQPVILPWASDTDDPDVKIRRFVDLVPPGDRSEEQEDTP